MFFFNFLFFHSSSESLESLLLSDSSVSFALTLSSGFSAFALASRYHLSPFPSSCEIGFGLPTATHPSSSLFASRSPSFIYFASLRTPSMPSDFGIVSGAEPLKNGEFTTWEIAGVDGAAAAFESVGAGGVAVFAGAVGAVGAAVGAIGTIGAVGSTIAAAAAGAFSSSLDFF